MAQRVVTLLSEPFFCDEREVRLGASIGVALNTLPDTNAETLLRYADRAMYRAKREGKARCVMFNPDIDGIDE